MIGKILVGGLCLAVGSGAWVGWRFARGEGLLPDFAAAEKAEHEDARPIEFARHELQGTHAAAPAARVEIEPPRHAPERALVPAGDRAGSDSAQPHTAVRATHASTASAEVAAWIRAAREGVPASAEQLESCVQALQSDAVRGNAMAALDLLSANGPRSQRLLERALLSKDEQQRALAACASVQLGGYSPTPELARILLGLLSPGPGESFVDVTPRPWIARVGRANLDERAAAFWALCTDAQLFRHVEAELEQRLGGVECAARFDAAFVIVQHPRARSRAQALAVLVEHLADNQLADDAALAMRQLARAPHESLPLVRAALPGRDPQQSRLLKHFLARFDPGHAAALALEPRELSSMGFYCGDMLAGGPKRR